MEKNSRSLLTFNNSFFEDEVRDDFFVPSIMKRVWASQMEILAEVARVCDILGVNYYLACGTLLGAVRHKGFIPWDDDIDICMKRKDYMRFLYNASRYLPEDYEIKSIYSGKHDYKDISMWIVNTHDLYLNDDSLKKHHGYPFRIGIDIFPLDALPVDEEREAFEYYTATIGVASYAYEYEGKTDEEKEQLVKNVEELCNVVIDRNGDIIEQLAILYDKITSIYQNEKSTPYTIMTTWKDKKDVFYDQACFDQVIDVPYEHVFFKAPADYIGVVKGEFGEYEKKIRGGSMHDYPLIDGQLKKMKSEKGLYYGKKVPDTSIIYNSLDRYNRRKNGLSSRTGLPIATDNQTKKIAILCFSARYWDVLDSFYQKASDDINSEIVVIAIPYYRKLMENSILHSSEADNVIENEIARIESEENHSDLTKTLDILEKIYDINDYPDYVNVLSYKDFSISKFEPDMIITNYPYDSNNAEIVVSSEFYSERLLNYTDELIYVQYFKMADIEPDDECSRYNIPYYVVMPGVINADKVYVQSDCMRLEYIKCLVNTYGEGTRHFWEAKVFVKEK